MSDSVPGVALCLEKSIKIEISMVQDSGQLVNKVISRDLNNFADRHTRIMNDPAPGRASPMTDPVPLAPLCL